MNAISNSSMIPALPRTLYLDLLLLACTLVQPRAGPEPTLSWHGH